MFGLGPAEIVLVLIIALIVFGPGRLPEIGSALGKTIREFRQASAEITEEFTREIEETKRVVEAQEKPVAKGESSEQSDS